MTKKQKQIARDLRKASLAVKDVYEQMQTHIMQELYRNCVQPAKRVKNA